MRMNKLEETLKYKGIVHLGQFDAASYWQGWDCPVAAGQGSNNPSDVGHSSS